jgi:hypothetical protein
MNKPTFDPKRYEAVRTALTAIGITINELKAIFFIEAFLNNANPQTTIKEIMEWKQELNNDIEEFNKDKDNPTPEKSNC